MASFVARAFLTLRKHKLVPAHGEECFGKLEQYKANTKSVLCKPRDILGLKETFRQQECLEGGARLLEISALGCFHGALTTLKLSASNV